METSESNNNNTENSDDNALEATRKMTIFLTVAGADGAPRVPLTLPDPDATTVSQLRNMASEITHIPLQQMKLIFRGRLMMPDDVKGVVAEYKLEEGSVVHCMGKPVVPGAADAASSSAAAAAPPVRPLYVPPTSLPTTTTASASGSHMRAIPTAPSVDPLQQALQTLRASNSAADYQTAVTTLEKILSNIIQNPTEEKYRSVKQQNPAFRKRLGGLRGGEAVMQAVGFRPTQVGADAMYVMPATAEAWPALLAAHAAVTAAMRHAAQAAAPAGGINPALLGNPMAGASPAMQQAVTNLLSNPAQLQAMLQNPAVQEMIRHHPQFANHPAGQQMMDMLMNDPAAIAQWSQMMMRDPALMQQAAMAMQQQQQGGGFGGAPAPNLWGPPPAAAAAPPAAAAPMNQASSSDISDEQMTEEQMIAEAIRRSLQDS